MRKLALFISLLAGLTFSSTGCSSLKVHKASFGYPYGGTSNALKSTLCYVVFSAYAGCVPLPVFLLDFPLSFVLDTVLLPFDLVIRPNAKRPEPVKCGR